MKFKDYLSDKKYFIAIYYLAIGLAMLITSLSNINSGYRINIYNLIYAFLIGSLFLALLIYFDYKEKKPFLDIIKESEVNMMDMDYIMNLPERTSREYGVIRDGYIRNYRYYVEDLEKYKTDSKLQKDFNNRWIHEMKTPVAVMKLVLERERENKATDEKLLNSLDEEIDKMSSSLEMALYTLRLGDFEKDFSITEINLLDISREAINENKSAFIMNSVYPKILFSQDVFVRSDEKWMRFVLKQILNNSIKYSKVKDIESREILLDIEETESSISLSIRDNGVGIVRGDLNRIFNPFFTGENGRRYKDSTGMGLYLVREILDRLGHGIEVESVEGEYTETKIVFIKGRSIYDF